MAQARGDSMEYTTYFINDDYKWGFQIFDSGSRETLFRGHSFATIVDAIDAAKYKIKELGGNTATEAK